VQKVLPLTAVASPGPPLHAPSPISSTVALMLQALIASVCCLSLSCKLCIVDKRCVLEQKLLMTVYIAS